MNLVATATLLQVFLTTTVLGAVPNEKYLTANLGEIVLLPCNIGEETPNRTKTTWSKDGQDVSPTPIKRVDVLNNGTLKIQEVSIKDEGEYLCTSILPNNTSVQARVQLHVVRNEPAGDVTASILATTILPNKTGIAKRGTSVSLDCTASSHPSQLLTWRFHGASYRNDTLASTSGHTLIFKMEDVQPDAQGVYTCESLNTVSNKTKNASVELLVYYFPDTHPDCSWESTPDLRAVCSWFGAYPAPQLRWEQNATWEETESTTATMNRSMLSDGQTLRCLAQHKLFKPDETRSCSLTLKSPYPKGEPMATALVGTSISLTCSETTSTPPANTTWRRGLGQESIDVGPKYGLFEKDATFTLTIFNVTKEDEGVYFCRSENPVAVRELEVYLTVKTASSAYAGAVIGVFIAALIVGSGVVVAKTLYSNRHRICLGGGLGQAEEERGDVLNLVESDDEQIFQDTVPRLPPLANGCHTTLAQIHRIPSSDHEEAEIADTVPELQEEPEEPEVLLTF